eukprot:gene2587-biopygen9523
MTIMHLLRGSKSSDQSNRSNLPVASNQQVHWNATEPIGTPPDDRARECREVAPVGRPQRLVLLPRPRRGERGVRDPVAAEVQVPENLKVPGQGGE